LERSLFNILEEGGGVEVEVEMGAWGKVFDEVEEGLAEFASYDELPG